MVVAVDFTGAAAAWPVTRNEPPARPFITPLIRALTHQVKQAPYSPSGG
jgi:hypothetical protein